MRAGHRACVVPGCAKEGRNKLGVRCRVWHDGPYSHGKAKTAALWAPDTDAYRCDEHALGGATITLLYEPDGSRRTTVRVIGARHADERVVDIREPADDSPAAVRSPIPRPPSILLLPAGGDDSARHFRDTVASPVDPARLYDWFPGAATEIRGRVVDRLAAWGLRDNTRLIETRAGAPLIWPRIMLGTLALFSDGERFSCAARVIGKGVSEEASVELWGSPEFRWLILLSDVRPVRIPLGVVIRGAGFQPHYRINRQALVPKAVRESRLWQEIEPYLNARRR